MTQHLVLHHIKDLALDFFDGMNQTQPHNMVLGL
jgi:hypothetical protein